MPVVGGHRGRPVRQQMQRRHDVHDRERATRGGMIERHPVRHPPAPVVARDVETVEPQSGHQRHLIARHRAKAIGRKVRGRRASTTRRSRADRP